MTSVSKPASRDLSGFLLDIDGTLMQDDRPIPGAVDTVAFLTRNNRPFLYLTNTTRRSRAEIRDRLAAAGFPATDELIFHPAAAAVALLKRRKVRRLCLLLPPEAKADFRDFTEDDRAPDAVVMGDLGSAYDYDRLNRAFRLVMGGARLVALQKNRYWLKDGSLQLDAGPFVKAVEYAAGVRAEVVGKPSKTFFLEAVRRLGLEPRRVGMVGDDPEADVLAAVGVGLAAFLVRTGKSSGRPPRYREIGPGMVLDSIADLRGLIGRAGR